MLCNPLEVCKLRIAAMCTLIVVYAKPSFAKNATNRRRVDSVVGTAGNLFC